MQSYDQTVATTDRPSMGRNRSGDPVRPSLMAPATRLKRKRKHDLRQIVNSILWLLRTGCHGAARAVAKPTGLLAPLASCVLLL